MLLASARVMHKQQLKIRMLEAEVIRLKTHEKRPSRNTMMVLWDAENMSFNFIDRAMQEVHGRWPVHSEGRRHAFGFHEGPLSPNFAHVQDKHGFVWHFNEPHRGGRKLKKAADMQLTVFALLSTFPGCQLPQSDVYLIVSDDTDFRPLMRALQMLGRRVIWYTKEGITEL